MKRVVIGALAIGSAWCGSAAFAGQNDDLVARLNAAEKENAAIRRENMELPGAKPAKPASFTDRMADFFGTYAADLPVAYKARPSEEPGRFRIWVEGGAIWTGGDPVSQTFSLTDFTTPNGGTIMTVTRPLASASQLPLSSGNSIPGIFDLTPKIGWEAATGFDYKFAGSPWHVSGQFRYGEGGKTSGSATSAGTLDPVFFPNAPFQLFNAGIQPVLGNCFNFPFSFSLSACGGSETFSASYKETHWLADLALGYDVAGYGPSAMQVKGGLRISEFVARTNTSDQFSSFATFSPPLKFLGTLISQATYANLTTEDIRDSFLGAGPLIGLEGSVPFLGAWSFDYKGDLAVLFGTQKRVETDKTIATTTPAILTIRTIGYSSIYTDTEARFATMLSADIQAGVSYWFTPNLKLGASYRIDTLIAVKNTKSANAENLLIPQRYWHGPRLTLTGQFAAN
jgi:opacity protein-like surface antigen